MQHPSPLYAATGGGSGPGWQQAGLRQLIGGRLFYVVDNKNIGGRFGGF